MVSPSSPETAVGKPIENWQFFSPLNIGADVGKAEALDNLEQEVDSAGYALAAEIS